MHTIHQVLELHLLSKEQRSQFEVGRAVLGTHTPTKNAWERARTMSDEEIEDAFCNALGVADGCILKADIIFSTAGDMGPVLRRLAAVILSRPVH